MTSLVLGTLFFVGIHLFVSGTTLRDRITDVIGELPYMGAFSLASLVGIVWMSSAYSAAPTIVLWGELPGFRPLMVVLTLVGFVFAVVGLMTPSPTAAGGETLLEEAEPGKGLLRITRHPGMWGIAIWAGAHIPANGDAASVVFFSGLTVLALQGPRSIDGKRARKLGSAWEQFASVTSNLPFAAIAQGRNRLVLSEVPLWKVAIALLVWGAMLGFHSSLFGASPLPL